MDDRGLYTDVVATVATTDAERLLVAAWEEVLGVRPIGADDNFIELGGTSMLAISLVARVEERIGIRLSADRVLTADTLSELARELDDWGA